MNNILITSDQVIQTIAYIVSIYQDGQSRYLADIREKVSPDYKDFSICQSLLLSNWETVDAKLQGISLLLSDLPDMCELCRDAQEKTSDLWKRCGDEVRELQFPEPSKQEG